MNETIKLEQTLAASITLEGFIEVTALDELDKIVGGFLQPDDIYLELEDDIALRQP